MKIIYRLIATGYTWDVDVGFFSSKKLAQKAWKEWKRDHKNTEWGCCKSDLIEIKLDEII